VDYYERLTSHFAKALLPQTEPYDWLRARGLTDESIERYQLGYVVDADNGLERFNNSISIPYLRPQMVGAARRVASVRFRYLVPRSHKYDSIRGSKAHLFNVEATDAKDIYITEGEFDAIILSQLGYPAVGVPGASLFNASWKYLFSGADSVVLVFDGDDAGDRGSQRIASILGEVCPVIRRAQLPPGTDVTELYLKSPRALVGAIT
jgi:DNA primase